VRVRDTKAALEVLTAAGQPARTLPDGTIELVTAAAVTGPDDIAGLLFRSGVLPTQLLVEEEELEAYFLRLVGSNGDAK
jgi:ABC-2 type transport system ATP-binding protein